MATANQNGVPDDLREQLALAVRSIQWSYAIFWSFSAKQSGALGWSEGYYNGDIKTRKTVQAVELNSDPLGLQRSDQLRELFESLSLGESTPQPKRPTAALSPEDLTDTEWYFLVCMSFVFNVGQGLPGRSYAENEMIWLRNAHLADTKLFARSLLAKSASLQTVVCFPHLGGVVELGTTELVPEDRGLIQHIKSSFLESSSDTVINLSHDLVYQVPDHSNIPENNLDEVEVYSPDTSSDEFADNVLIEGSCVADGADGEASQLQSWQCKDDAVSNGTNNATSSSDCVSQTHGKPELKAQEFDGKKSSAANCVPVSQECNQQTLPSFNGGGDVHYHSVLSSLLKSSHQLILGPYRNGKRGSSFISWNNRKSSPRLLQSASPQRLLKKVLFEVARLHENESAKSKDRCDDRSVQQEGEEVDKNHVLSERKRREKISERFAILGSLVPSGGKVDKVSLLDHTIEYLRELERKVQDLEAYKEATERESTTQSRAHDAMERTSDNYGHSKLGSITKLLGNKKRASDVEKTAPENKRARSSSSTDSITISITDKDVLIEMRCSWRQCVLIQVMEALTQLNLESQSVQSSNTDGILSLSINAKSKGVKGASAGAIKQALQKIIRKN
ncbi:transcription factor EGL1-like isoform X2 [Salvia splendens]|uniref:transcription factor EGL1-like isoform X1 n=1 Tax=Salvia splendens TaxID=180675 RepID=UPI001C2790C3|nr:transcription factor EGL1-like isoform X1 [Salvia splendens]XP_042007021.1 transcription factor EGL1-like isoform X2 [Salvia splendens]